MHIRVIFLTAAGLLLLALGFIGVFLPVWPTTPFVLAGAACLTGTPKLRAKVLRISFFREYIENYESRQGLSRKTVIKSLTFLWVMLILSMIKISRLPLTCLLTLIGICVTAHILWIAKPKEGSAK
ncbi:MAG: YbaN family protein [Clostridiales bacterium]